MRKTNRLLLILILLIGAMTLAIACNDIRAGNDSDWYDYDSDGGSGNSGGGGGGDDDDDNSSGDDDSADDDDSGGEGCVVADAPTYSNFGQCFFSAYCTRCHKSGGVAFPLSSLSDIKNRANSVLSAVENGSMPPNPPDPSDQEIQQLADWIDAGLPE